MSSKSNLKIKIKKIDAIIVIVLIIIAGLVLIKVGYTFPFQEEIIESDAIQDDIIPTPPPPPIPPESITMGYMRAVSPEDEGAHFDKINICRAELENYVFYPSNVEMRIRYSGFDIPADLLCLPPGMRGSGRCYGPGRIRHSGA